MLAFLALRLATGSFDFTVLAGFAREGKLTQMLGDALGWKDLTYPQFSAVIFAGALFGFAVKVPLMRFTPGCPPLTPKRLQGRRCCSRARCRRWGCMVSCGFCCRYSRASACAADAAAGARGGDDRVFRRRRVRPTT